MPFLYPLRFTRILLTGYEEVVSCDPFDVQ